MRNPTALIPAYTGMAMAQRFEHSEDDELTEILRRAVRKESVTSTDLRRRLMAAADELGISPEAVAQAESEYRMESAQQRELALYKKEIRNVFNIHLVSFLAVNLCMFGINMLDLQKDHELWFLYIVLPWSIGLVIHGYISLFRKPDWDDEEFQKWREERAEKALERGEIR